MSFSGNTSHYPGENLPNPATAPGYTLLEQNKTKKLKKKFEMSLEDFVGEFYTLIMEYAEKELDVPQEYRERWLFDEGDPVADGESKDISNALENIIIKYNKFAKVVYLITIQNLLEEYYTVESSFLNYGNHNPPLKVEIAIDLKKYVEVYCTGLFYLVNKKTGNKLILELGDKDIFLSGLKKNKEIEIFKELLESKLQNNDVFKNKTFTFDDQMNPKFIEKHEVKRGDVILEDKIWKQIDINVINVFRRNEEYKKKNIPTKRGVMLEGPPGNGKSMVIKYLENELNGEVTFIYVTDSTAKINGNIGIVFDIAQKYTPCVIVCEDVDSIGGSRNYESSNSNVTPELLSRLDGLEKLEDIVFIASTNYPERIDDALRLRPSRFDRRIKINRPKGKSVIELVKKFLENKGLLNFSDAELEPVATKLNDFSGAQIGEVVVTAQMISLYDEKPLSINHLMEATVFMQENYYDDTNIGKDKSKKAVGFRKD